MFCCSPLRNDKTMSLWQMARAHVQECLTTGCNFLSRQIFFERFLSTTLSYFPFKMPQTFNKTWKSLYIFFLVLIDGGFEGLILMLLCCRVRRNPHQSAVKENKSKTNKKKKEILSLHSAFQLYLLKHRNVANDTIGPSGTWNVRGISRGGVQARWALVQTRRFRPGLIGRKTVCVTSAKGRVCSQQTRLLKIKRAPMWMALYLTNDKCSFSHEAGLKEGWGGEEEGIPRAFKGFRRRGPQTT